MKKSRVWKAAVELSVRQALPQDLEVVSAILTEAAEWLVSIGQPLWPLDELTPEKLRNDVGMGLYFIAFVDGVAAGVLRFQLEDTLVWPDIPPAESTFIHRLAVARAFSGRGVPEEMLAWAKKRTRELERKYVRLDCVPRPKLCAVYEKYGFTRHSYAKIRDFDVVRYECAVMDKATD